MSDLYLLHHGIMGQKWGVRRYQNEDGTLTAAGRKRLSKYVDDSGELTKKGKKVYGKYYEAKTKERLADEDYQKF